MRDTKRLDKIEAIDCFMNLDFFELARAADRFRWALHPEPVVTYIVDRNINYTNICNVRCDFCAFSVALEDPKGYVLTKEEIFRKIEDALSLGATQILMQGGLHPGLKIGFFEDLFRSIKSRFSIHIHSLSPPEIAHISKTSGLSIREALLRLRAAGLDSLPGGGAEILVDRVRKRLSNRKITSDEWLNIMREAHKIGMATTATMMFGSVEEPSDIIEHLFKIRELQDETGGFTAFIPWSYQPGNTVLGGNTATGTDYLRLVAISRLVLDNVKNIQASWVTQGLKVAQVALFCGANDLGNVMIEENVIAATGVKNSVSESELQTIIRSAGFTPAKRNTKYEIIKYH